MGHIPRIRALARGKFDSIFHRKDDFNSRQFGIYLYRRWNNVYPRLELVEISGYVRIDETGFHVNKAAFDLLREAEPYVAFISYYRKESSALALLLRARLKAVGIGDAFVDMTIPAGVDWERRIEQEIQKRGHFILVLGKNTLNSETVVKEIEWALYWKKTIIPIWHNRYKYVPGRFPVRDEIVEIISRKNAIRVLEESASGYETALIELLNFFGVTP